ncbi:MAG: flagellar basal body rod protein FlgB [Gammaproteobacteria bacterium]|nr:MAG: flagellar basal body rod protein FlgB [Gammaproteobacteria bacterium]
MPLDVNQVFAPHERVLTAASQRMELLAANIANADTPNFKARDIDFRAVLQAAGENGPVTLTATNPMHIQGVGGPGARAEALYRVPEQPSLDGNTVDAQKESAAVAETATRYQTSLTLLDQRIRGLRAAITGGR